MTVSIESAPIPRARHAPRRAPWVHMVTHRHPRSVCPVGARRQAGGVEVDSFDSIFEGVAGNDQHAGSDADVADRFYSLASDFYQYGYVHILHHGATLRAAGCSWLRPRVQRPPPLCVLTSHIGGVAGVRCVCVNSWGESFHFGPRHVSDPLGHGAAIANAQQLLAQKLQVGDMSRVADFGYAPVHLQ